MWKNYFSPSNVSETLELLAQYQSSAKIAAGTTDLILEFEKGGHKEVKHLIDISRIQGLDTISLDEKGNIHIGPMVTHNQCTSSRLIREFAFPLAVASWNVGSPQIRNRGTVAGNLITGSPANDTISPLMALDARVVLQSQIHTREIPLKDFYLGVRKTVLRPDEMLIDITFPAMKKNQCGAYKKFALRRAQAISLVNAAIILSFNENMVEAAAITLGAVAPTIIHASEAEEYLKGRELSEETIKVAADLACKAAQPISDVRSSDKYRKRMTCVLVHRALTSIAKNENASELPEKIIKLTGKDNTKATLEVGTRHETGTPIVTNINGKTYEFTAGQNKTLLRLLREEAALTGTKEGCAEGECGACTVYLDGAAVMSCLVPAPRAHGANIVTVEGITQKEGLHPVQEAFIEKDAVQCGYCTPGFVMSAVKLLEEDPDPDHDEIRQAISGNLCRCTGYYKIVQAIELAAQKMA